MRSGDQRATDASETQTEKGVCPREGQEQDGARLLALARIARIGLDVQRGERQKRRQVREGYVPAQTAEQHAGYATAGTELDGDARASARAARVVEVLRNPMDCRPNLFGADAMKVGLRGVDEDVEVVDARAQP